jgi:hypothetical protein
VIVPLAEPIPAAAPAADDDETRNSPRVTDTAVKRSSATDTETVRESSVVTTDAPRKRRPVIIRPDHHDDSKSKRANPVRVVRGGSDSEAGPSADVTDDGADGDRQKMIASSASAKRSKLARPAPGFYPSAARSNPLR